MRQVVLLLALAVPALVLSEVEAQDEDAETVPSVSEQTGPDGRELADQLGALQKEVDRQVGVIRKRSADGDTRGAEEAKSALAEARDRLAVILPVEDEPKAEEPKPAPQESAADRAVSVQISDLRSALTLYSAEHNGDFPKALEALVPKYVKEIPKPALARHPNPPAPRQFAKVGQVDALDSQLKDTGAWLYVSDPESPLYGSLLVDCTHQNSSGQEWFKE